jgi:hypothetical protein
MTYRDTLMKQSKGNLMENIINNVSEHTPTNKPTASRKNSIALLDKIINLPQAKNLTGLSIRLNNIARHPATHPNFAKRVAFYSNVAKARAQKRSWRRLFKI